MYNSGSVTAMDSKFYDGSFSGLSISSNINCTGVPIKYDLGYSGTYDNKYINSYTVSNSGVITELYSRSANETGYIGPANIISDSASDSIGYQMYGGYRSPSGSEFINYESFSINPSTGEFSDYKYLKCSGKYISNPIGYYGPNVSMILTDIDSNNSAYKYFVNKEEGYISSARVPPYYYAKTGKFIIHEDGLEGKLMSPVYGHEGNYNTVVYDYSTNRFTYTCNIKVSYDDSSNPVRITITDKTPVVYMDDVVHHKDTGFIKFKRMSNGFSYPDSNIDLNFYIDDKSRIYKCSIPLIEDDSVSASNMYELSLD